VFDRVSFDYGFAPDGCTQSALADVTLEIARGETIALVGGSGAGKSTLINLLCRIADPTAGEIRVDGVPLTEIDIASWRRRIGFAGQDADLRPGTIRDNISYGEPDATPDQIQAAAMQAQVHAVIEGLPKGYETPVGVRGTQLSGGERQRVALARALLRNPEILILDEATNAVDNATEAAIRRTLQLLAGRVTTIIIAHRLSSTREANRIVVMHEGRIVEVGRRTELVERRGAFSRLLDLEVG
jgi:ABC-type multidrug transport system fused ATPase/permease subunit